MIMRRMLGLVWILVALTACPQFQGRGFISPINGWGNAIDRVGLSDVVFIGRPIGVRRESWVLPKVGRLDGFSETVEVIRYLKGTGPKEIRLLRSAQDFAALRTSSDRPERVLEAEAGKSGLGLFFLKRTAAGFQIESTLSRLLHPWMRESAPPPPPPWPSGSASIPLDHSEVDASQPIDIQICDLFLANLAADAPVRNLQPLYTYSPIGTPMGRQAEGPMTDASELVPRLKWFATVFPSRFQPRNDEERFQELYAQVNAGLTLKSMEFADVGLKVGDLGSLPSGLSEEAAVKLADRGTDRTAATVFWHSLASRLLPIAAGRIGHDPDLDSAILEFLDHKFHVYCVGEQRERLSQAKELLDAMSGPGPSVPDPKTFGAFPDFSLNFLHSDIERSNRLLVGRVQSTEPPAKGVLDPIFYTVAVTVEQDLTEGKTGTQRFWLDQADYQRIFAGGDATVAKLQRTALRPGQEALWLIENWGPTKLSGKVRKALALPARVRFVERSDTNATLALARLLFAQSVAEPIYLTALAGIGPLTPSESYRNPQSAADRLSLMRWASETCRRIPVRTKVEVFTVLRILRNFGWPQANDKLNEIACELDEAGKSFDLDLLGNDPEDFETLLRKISLQDAEALIQRRRYWELPGPEFALELARRISKEKSPARVLRMALCGALRCNPTGSDDAALSTIIRLRFGLTLRD